MSFGIRDISKVAKDEAIVRCNWCDNFFYDEITDERNDNSLSFIWDKNGRYFFKGCPLCQTDDYLANYYIPDEEKWQTGVKSLTFTFQEK